TAFWRNQMVSLSRNLSSASTDLFAEALAYCRRGWSIIPTHEKKPARCWKSFQDRAADAEALRRLFDRTGIDGLAVVTGRVSGGLAVRDFDQDDAYHAWADAHPVDSISLPTVQTARGFHVYGAIAGERF